MNVIVKLTAWLCFGIIVFVTLSSQALRPELFGHADLDRVSAFALLSLLFGLSYPRRLTFVLLTTVGAAVVLEFLQTLTVDRHGHFEDMLVKVTGALIGVLIARTITRVWLGPGKPQRIL